MTTSSVSPGTATRGEELPWLQIGELGEPLGVAPTGFVEFVDMPRLELETTKSPSHLVVVARHSMEAAPPLVQSPQGFIRREVLLVEVGYGVRVLRYHRNENCNVC